MFRIDGTKLTYVTETKVGGWGQGVAWSKDGKTLLFQAMLTKELQILDFDGKVLQGDRRQQGSAAARPDIRT